MKTQKQSTKNYYNLNDLLEFRTKELEENGYKFSKVTKQRRHEAIEMLELLIKVSNKYKANPMYERLNVNNGEILEVAAKAIFTQDKEFLAPRGQSDLRHFGRRYDIKTAIYSDSPSGELWDNEPVIFINYIPKTKEFRVRYCNSKDIQEILTSQSLATTYFKVENKHNGRSIRLKPKFINYPKARVTAVTQRMQARLNDF